jgi:flagellar basal-body rod modification protein FlgD
MSVEAIASASQAAGTPTATQLAALNAATGATGGSSSLSESDFLKLLTTQLQNQDPLQPMSDTAFIAQMATFSQLSAENTLNTNFSDYSQSQAITTAQSYIGQTVTVSGAAEGAASATGTVTGVVVNNSAPELTINGINYSVSDVTAIQSPSVSSSTAAAAAAAANNSNTPSTPTPSTASISTGPTTPTTTTN